MSDTGAPTPAGYEPLTPPEDFGKELVDQFVNRAGSTMAAADDDAEMERQVASILTEPETSTAAAADDEAVDTPPEEQAATTAQEAPAGSEPAGAVPPVDETPAVDETPPVDESGYVWNWTDENTQAPQAQRFTDEQVQQALRLAADQRVSQGLSLIEWAQTLTPAQREAMGEIATGQAVTVARADYDQYQAWRHSQETASRYPDLDQFEPEAAKIIRDQQEQLARLQGPQPAQQAPVDEAPQAQAQQAQALARGYNDAVGGIRDSWRLSDAEVDQLYAGARPFIAGLQVEGSEFNPITGQLSRPADPAHVMYEAFTIALTRNPALHEAVLQRREQATTPAGQAGEATTPGAAPVAPVSDKVAAKRANAASLASAPSAAVTPAPRSVRQMSNQEINDAMAERLAQAMNGDG